MKKKKKILEQKDIRTDRFVSKKGDLKKITSMSEFSEGEIKFLKERGLYEQAKKQMEQK